MEIEEILFYAIMILTILSATIVAFSSKIIYSAFALLLTFMGFSGFYIYLSADFLAVIQILIYVGGILILILFGVLMTQRIYDPSTLSTQNSIWLSVGGGIAFAAILALIIYRGSWSAAIEKPYQATTNTIGTAILGDYLLPFEIASLLLLGALIGAVYIARAGSDTK
jgi:NADH-quinone oxidoreductase subunit J